MPSQVAPAGPATDEGAEESLAVDAGEPGAEGEGAVEEPVSVEGEPDGQDKESTDS